MAITYHANVERKARFEYIEATVGFGTKEIASYTFKSPDSRKPSKSVLTETGVIKVYSCETGNLVTAYIATIGQGVYIYKKCFNCDKCPREFMQILYDNQYYMENQP